MGVNSGEFLGGDSLSGVTFRTMSLWTMVLGTRGSSGFPWLAERTCERGRLMPWLPRGSPEPAPIPASPSSWLPPCMCLRILYVSTPILIIITIFIRISGIVIAIFIVLLRISIVINITY